METLNETENNQRDDSAEYLADRSTIEALIDECATEETAAPLARLLAIFDGHLQDRAARQTLDLMLERLYKQSREYAGGLDEWVMAARAGQ
jgi:hypothetical protein